MSPEEIQKLLAVAPPDRRIIYEVALLSGLRAGELRSLCVGDLDVANYGLRLHSKWTKGRRDGFQRLPASLVMRLKEICRRKKNEAKLLDMPIRPSVTIIKDLKAAGIERKNFYGKLDFHALRTTFINLVLHSGAGAKEAQALARHIDPKLTFNIYARSDSAQEAAVIERIGETILNEETKCRKSAES